MKVFLLVAFAVAALTEGTKIRGYQSYTKEVRDDGISITLYRADSNPNYYFTNRHRVLKGGSSSSSSSSKSKSPKSLKSAEGLGYVCIPDEDPDDNYIETDNLVDNVVEEEELKAVEILLQYAVDPDGVLAQYSKEELRDIVEPVVEYLNTAERYDDDDTTVFDADDILAVMYRTEEERVIDQQVLDGTYVPLTFNTMTTTACINSLIQFVAEIFTGFLNLIGLAASASEKVALKVVQHVIDAGSIVSDIIAWCIDNLLETWEKIKKIVRAIIDNFGLGTLWELIKSSISTFDLVWSGVKMFAGLALSALTAGATVLIKLVEFVKKLGGWVIATVNLVKDCTT